MAKRMVVLYLEGETDEEFYRAVVEDARRKMPSKRLKVDKLEFECIKGISKFSVKLLKKFRHEVVEKYEGYEKIVFLCYDVDVFKQGINPPVDRKKLEKDLYDSGATKVIHLVADLNIEDWFMLDKEGILKFLGLNNRTKIKGSTGLEQIKHLFADGRKVYQKGYRVNGLVASLNIEKIRESLGDELASLYEELGVKCS